MRKTPRRLQASDPPGQLIDATPVFRSDCGVLPYSGAGSCLPMKKILVVDDEPAVLFALAEALVDKRRGLQVVTAANGREAMRVLQEEKIHLVVSDLRMPEVDGFELLAHLRRTHPSLPVILMTALGPEETSARLGAEGALECLSKPFDVEVLRQKIADMLAQRVQGRVENISLASFLQLLEIERKTCTLSITSGGRRGRLYFRGGKLVGAETGELRGAPAALRIVVWEHAEIEIADGCPVSGPPLQGGLAFLLMEAMRIQDEAAEEERRGDDDLDALLADPQAAAAAPGGRDPEEKIREALAHGGQIEGAVATLLIETETGALVAATGSGLLDLVDAAAAMAGLAQQKARAEEHLGREPLEEILVTSARSRYLLRPVDPAGKHFLLMILDRRKGDLGKARTALAAIAAEL
jgi:CheY-like chemotaxis protein/predicted regulator of Ras-like GTPase activity (Roadblock/LC7/MglB family)